MNDMHQASLTDAHCRPLTSTRTTSLSQPRSAHVSALTATLVNQCSAGLMSRSCDHKKLLNRSPLAFRHSFTMHLQFPTSIRSGNTLPTPYTLLLWKRLDIVDCRSQLGSTMNVARQQLILCVASNSCIWSIVASLGRLGALKV